MSVCAATPEVDRWVARVARTPALDLGRGDDMTDFTAQFNEFDPSVSTLEPLGFGPHFADAYQSCASPGARPFRVTRVDAEGCTLLGEHGPGRGRLPKRVRARTPPVVGDWVVARDRRGELIVKQVLERRTSLTRRAAGADGRAQVLAANLDRALICMSLERDFRLARLERWLTLAYEGGVTPLVLLTKAGLVGPNERSERTRAAESVAPGVEVVALDVFAGIGIEALDRALVSEDPWAKTLAVVGSSGVGKSTLLNYLLNSSSNSTSSDKETARTQDVSAAHGKGRHTTSHRELFELPGRDLLLIDTPGLREVGLWGEGRGLDSTFAELSELAAGCRFSDCQHDSEPGCAVRAALASGQLDPRRFESWQGLRHEQAATARRASEHERRHHERQFARLYRDTLAAKRRRRGG